MTHGASWLLGPAEREFLKRLAAVDPTSPALLSLARHHLEDGDLEAAEKIASRIMEAHPQVLDAPLILARALASQGEAERAREILTRALAGLDDLARQLSELSEVLNQCELRDEAVRAECAAQALRMPPAVEEGPEEDWAVSGQAVPTETLAELYLAQGHREEAARVYREILALDPENVRVKGLLAGLERPEEPALEEAPEEAAWPGPITSKQRHITRLERLQAAARRRRETVEAVSA